MVVAAAAEEGRDRRGQDGKWKSEGTVMGNRRRGERAADVREEGGGDGAAETLKVITASASIKEPRY